MNKPLAGKKIAILAASGFNENEFTEPHRLLTLAGAEVKIISAGQGLVNGWGAKGWGHYYPVDFAIADTIGADYDMLYIPGGDRSISKLESNPHCKRIISTFIDGRRPLVICSDAIKLLAQCDNLTGYRMAISPEFQNLVADKGVLLDEDQAVVRDTHLLTSSSLEAASEILDLLLDHFSDEEVISMAA